MVPLLSDGDFTRRYLLGLLRERMEQQEPLAGHGYEENAVLTLPAQTEFVDSSTKMPYVRHSEFGCRRFEGVPKCEPLWRLRMTIARRDIFRLALARLASDRTPPASSFSE